MVSAVCWSSGFNVFTFSHSMQKCSVETNSLKSWSNIFLFYLIKLIRAGKFPTLIQFKWCMVLFCSILLRIWYKTYHPDLEKRLFFFQVLWLVDSLDEGICSCRLIFTSGVLTVAIVDAVIVRGSSDVKSFKILGGSGYSSQRQGWSLSFEPWLVYQIFSNLSDVASFVKENTGVNFFFISSSEFHFHTS